RLRITRRRLLGGGVFEEILFSNESGVAVETVVSVECAADFEDIYAVRGYAHASRRGELEEAVEDGCLRYAYRRGGFSRGTMVRISGVEADYGPGVVSFDLRLGSGETKRVAVSVTLEEGGEEVRSEERASLYDRAPGLETGWTVLRRSWERSVEDLSSLTFDAGDGLLVPAAGAPWYMALFGRDSLITAYGAMILSPEPAKNVLRALARHQAKERDDFTDAEPGKIAHELRRGELAFFGEVPQTPYYGTADATPLFLILLDEVHRWTADANFVWEMEPAARRALAWILEHSDKVNGYVAYHTRSTAGLKNQSWKDSEDSMLFSDGTRAEGPIAPVEVQGYVYDALCRTAGLAESVWGDPELAAKLRKRAASLKERFNRDFWMEDRGYYALALDGEGRWVDSITSNPGHLLWSGVLPVERARVVADRLTSNAMFGGWGIRTMAAGEGGYDPDSYHNGSVWPHDNAVIAHGLRRYGFAREAERITAALLDAAPRFDCRLPELFAGYSREEAPEPVQYPTSCSPQAWTAATIPLLVRVMLGTEPDPERRTLLTDPTERASGLRLDGVPAFGERHDIRV
ncbi:MAG TPA: glycogen debranching N-terminal domain-containing protein, partial [Rubrobacteraceae bacterium]|nr:glycogen debranching N-terminal domain-containing protein [Rubrobacteraceae bacterium]